MQTSWLFDAELSRFDEFLKVLWGAACRDDDALPDLPPDGIGELEAEPLPISYALDRASHFCAFRWYEVDATRGTLVRYEAFFLRPASVAAQVGLRVFAVRGANQAAAASPTPPTWWTEGLTLPAAPISTRILPGFVELVALLAANGDVATTSAEAASAVTELTHELGYYRQLSSDLAEELRLSQAKVRDLRSRPSTTVLDLPETPDAAEPAKDLSGLTGWALQNTHRITVLPRALYGAKKSLYENPSAVYGALELLAGPYREHRMGRLDKDGFNRELAAAGVQLAGSVGQTTAGSYGEDYFVAWEGHKRFLDFHLVKGGGRDERYCMRIYFFWDDGINQVVVGWLPSHLRNSLS